MMTNQQQENKQLLPPRVAIVTGANSGIGYGIMQRILKEDETVYIVMACRNSQRAEVARQQLLQQFPGAQTEIQVVDLASVQSVLDFCTRIKAKHAHINYVFCNAGIMLVIDVNYGEMFRTMLRSPVKLLESSHIAVQPQGLVNDDGVGSIFAANVFGHFIMTRELEPLLDASRDGRVIWTSSMSSASDHFDMEDWQGINNVLPYESSKWAMDLVAIGSNDRYKAEKLQITSFTISPGVVASGIGGVPDSAVAIRRVFHYMYRLCGIASQTTTGYDGAISTTHVAFKPLETLDPRCRYYSLTSRLGRSYVDPVHVKDYDPTMAKELISRCEESYQSQLKRAGSNAKAATDTCVQ